MAAPFLSFLIWLSFIELFFLVIWAISFSSFFLQIKNGSGLAHCSFFGLVRLLSLVYIYIYIYVHYTQALGPLSGPRYILAQLSSA